jgi:hypothetical protein
MQAYAKGQGRSAHCLKALLVHLKTPLQFERDTHGTPSVILMSGRHPKHDEQVVTHRGRESPPIRAHDVKREIV